MSYYSQWQALLSESGTSPAADEAIKQYYQMETTAYERILNRHETEIRGNAADLSAQLGFGQEMVTFVGFLDGINSSLRASLDLESVQDETEIVLSIDFRRLYRQMHEVKADWLYSLKTWDQVIAPEEQQSLTREYRLSKIVHREKIGRNDPCPCGSGKKYKTCCGKEV
jgi:hypothetical protein